MDDKRVSLVLTNHLDELERLAPLMERFGECNCFTSKEIFRVNLALDELITNIISYGYLDDNEHQICLDISIRQGRLTMRLIDDAKPFNPLEAPPAETHLPIEQRKCQIGGLGIEIVRKIMDRISYERLDEKNILTMEKKIQFS
jgi:serine/threonine-protein kinase RsbW